MSGGAKSRSVGFVASRDPAARGVHMDGLSGVLSTGYWAIFAAGALFREPGGRDAAFVFSSPSRRSG